MGTSNETRTFPSGSQPHQALLIPTGWTGTPLQEQSVLCWAGDPSSCCSSPGHRPLAHTSPLALPFSSVLQPQRALCYSVPAGHGFCIPHMNRVSLGKVLDSPEQPRDLSDVTQSSLRCFGFCSLSVCQIQRYDHSTMDNCSNNLNR